MWIFGYGSLMWDRWEDALGCVRRVKAEVRGYRRAFNKASVRNWGSKDLPCPTLNLLESSSSHCYGIAFEFPDDRRDMVLSYLTSREGKDFALREIPARLDQGDEITVIVPVYEGKNLIPSNDIKHVAEMVRQSKGKDGPCIQYVKGITDELRRLGIDDPAVQELWYAVVEAG